MAFLYWNKPFWLWKFRRYLREDDSPSNQDGLRDVKACRLGVLRARWWGLPKVERQGVSYTLWNLLIQAFFLQESGFLPHVIEVLFRQP